jgi:hypothetical protein
MVTKYLLGCRGSNESPGESLLQYVLDDPLLALARIGGKSVLSREIIHLS